MELIITEVGWGVVINCCVVYIFSKGTQPFDFIKCNANKVKCVGKINGGLLMFFGNSRIRFFKISWLDCGQC